MSPIFLTLADVIEIHRDQIERYGGDSGTRDYGLLQSAVAMPKAGSAQGYFHNDLYEMAAAYLFHITRTHPFVDGNKRTGVVAALVFLDLNGIEVSADENVLVETVLAVAVGTADKQGIATFFRTHSHPHPGPAADFQ